MPDGGDGPHLKTTRYRRARLTATRGVLDRGGQGEGLSGTWGRLRFPKMAALSRAAPSPSRSENRFWLLKPLLTPADCTSCPPRRSPFPAASPWQPTDRPARGVSRDLCGMGRWCPQQSKPFHQITATTSYRTLPPPSQFLQGLGNSPFSVVTPPFLSPWLCGRGAGLLDFGDRD